MFEIFRGEGIAPTLVGFARGALEAAVLGAIVAVSQEIQNYDFTVLGLNETESTILAMGALLSFRGLEGAADQIDPSKKRR